MARASEVVGAGKNGVFVSGEVDGISFAECLTVTVGGVEFKRKAAASGEDRRKRPAAEEAADYAVLALEEGWLVNREEVIDEFAVKRLEAIAGADIVRIHGGKAAGGLNDRDGAQSLAVSEVLLKSQAVPVGHFESDEAGVVIAVADAGVFSDAGCQLSVAAEG